MKSRGVSILSSHGVIRATGRKVVERAVVARLEDGKPTKDERRFPCDIICMSGGFEPASSLIRQAGGRTSYDDSLGEAVPTDLPSTVYAAGDVTGVHNLQASILQGRLAGSEAAASLGRTASEPDMDAIRRDLDSVEKRYRRHVSVATTTGISGLGKRRFVCFCEDVTTDDIKDAIEEGFDDIQTLKRYSTVTIGPCQGKMCLKALVGLCAHYTGRAVDETGSTTARPPSAAGAFGRAGRAVPHTRQADADAPEAP